MNSFRFPFDWKNPRGYLIAWILLYILQGNTIHFLTCCFNNGVGVYMLTMSLNKEIKNDFCAFMTLVKRDPDPMMFFNPLYDLIEFQSRLKLYERNQTKSFVCKTLIQHIFLKTIFRYARNLSNVFQPMIMALFAANFITISLSMLSIQIGMVNLNQSVLLKLLLNLLQICSLTKI